MSESITLKTLVFSTALFSSSLLFAAEPQTLTVYAEEYFAAEWGAGPAIKSQFERQYAQCRVALTPFDSRTTMLNRLRLEGKNSKADVVVGIDNHQLEAAEKSRLFAPNDVDLARLELPVKWQNHTFLPYDFSKYAFIYDKTKLRNPPQSLHELIERRDLKVLYQDPRTSSIGRGLIVWVNEVYPQDQVAEAWKKLSTHTVTVGKGWSETYGAFLKGEADLVLSNNTSPIYHLLQDKTDKYAATEFSEGEVLQVELAAKVAGKNNACADLFLNYLLSPQAQTEIAAKGVMLPVIAAPTEPHYDALKSAVLKSKVLDSMKVSAAQLKSWIAVWQGSLTE
ncbi:thiamine ABC transporter substrate binding subunit [Pasteurellaceae bacterium LIM206]|nr:thiamine ABC transporter substrate binding subunit [Pasteurellaceae bacterium LIM206]